MAGVVLNADVARFTSEIFTQQENSISFCVAGASLLLALSASVCPEAEIVLQADVFRLLILKVCYIIFIDGVVEVSVVISVIETLQAFKTVYFTFCRFNTLHTYGFN